jgi:hypothetical protein
MKYFKVYKKRWIIANIFSQNIVSERKNVKVERFKKKKMNINMAFIMITL